MHCACYSALNKVLLSLSFSAAKESFIYYIYTASMDNNRYQIMMEARGVVCCKCRQRLPLLTQNSTGVKCPICNMMNPVPTCERSRSKDVKAKENISGPDLLISSKKTELLNKMPSPSEISRSSSGTRTARKRALLIGVTYKRKHLLKGTINDVKSMRGFLIKNFGFKEENIRVLKGIFM